MVTAPPALYSPECVEEVLSEVRTGLREVASCSSVEGVRITGLATGVAVGLLQWGLLRVRLLVASLWPLVVAIAWPLGWTVTWASGIDVERGYYVFGSSGALVFAAVTGLAMLLMLRGRIR